MKSVSLFAAKVIASIALLAGVVMPAAAGQITSTGSGWCNASSCNNTNTSSFNNTYADNLFHNWLAFDLIALQGQLVTDATINIFNHSLNTAANKATYNLYQASSINFGGLVSGVILGTVKGAEADKNVGHFVKIHLNAEGLKALNASAGKSIVFGGVGTAGSEFFGYTGGRDKAFLKLESKAIPEPANVALFGLGLLAFVGARRRKQK
jgi:hypothetical protein